ncbi:hypothetical protein [Bacillus cereus]|uniref:hypothetical protein n=1 Tax=Bacillus cereus TaxID=1396 RepID=UPI002AC1F267|nr:hypothetical protein [Bacillus cereus]MDZ4567483.1 hypothetical protein [Bacillus cereus]
MKGFNFVSKEEQGKWLGKNISFEIDNEIYYGKINQFGKAGVEIKWDGPCPNDEKLGGIVVYANVEVTLSLLKILEG